MITKIRKIFKAKFIFSLPKKCTLLIFDKTGNETILDAIKYKNIKFSYCCTRKEEFNFFVLISVILKFKFSYKSYLLEYIRLSKPKVIITFIDNNLFFYELKKNFPKINFISIQNGYRFLNDEMLSTLKKKEFSNPSYSSDYYFVFNNQIKKIMEKYIKTKFIVSGSLKNNKTKVFTGHKQATNCIGFISRYTNAISNSLIEKNKLNPDYIVHLFCSKLLKNLALYCKKNKKKIMILTSKSNLKNSEKFYYKEILADYDYDYLYKENELDSYYNLDKVDMIVSPSSTLGSEALGKGYKVLTFSEDKILGSNFGWPYIKELQGPFFSNNYEYENLERMLNYLTNISNDDWKNTLKKFQDFTCAYDEDNKQLNEVIYNIIK